MIFCNHKWDLKSETVTKSKYDYAVEALSKAGAKSTKLPWQLCDGDRKHIQVFTCDKCGELKRYVENI